MIKFDDFFSSLNLTFDKPEKRAKAEKILSEATVHIIDGKQFIDVQTCYAVLKLCSKPDSKKTKA